MKARSADAPAFLLFSPELPDLNAHGCGFKSLYWNNFIVIAGSKTIDNPIYFLVTRHFIKMAFVEGGIDIKLCAHNFLTGFIVALFLCLFNDF